MAALSAAPVLSTIIVGLSSAFVAGFAAAKLRLSPIVGYLITGILIGPFTPGFIGDVEVATQLAEIGIVLLMFGVGLKFSIKDLMEVKKIALPGALCQILVATLLGAWIATVWGWSIESSVLFGLSLSVASTVVLLRALEERDELHSIDGQIAVGWLIVEDLAIVLVLVMIPALAHVFDGVQTPGEKGLALSLAIGMGKVALFFAVMESIGRKVLPWMLSAVAKTRSRELFTLAVFAVAVGVSFGAANLFGVSFALGAFFAGMMIKESELANEVTEKALPFQDAFAVLFFVSVGMLFDPHILVQQGIHVLVVLFVVIVSKFLSASAVVLLFRYPARTALTISASLAQIGEFSFVLGTLGLVYKVLSEEAYNLILAGSLASITLNPLLFYLSDALCKWLKNYPNLKKWLESGTGDLSHLSQAERRALKGLVVVIGFGRVGSFLQKTFRSAHMDLVVIDQNRELVEEIREMGIHAIAGDGMYKETLEEAAIDRAVAVVVAVPNPYEARQIVHLVRELNPKAAILARARSKTELEYFQTQNVDLVVSGEKEAARCMVNYLHRRYKRAF